LRDLVEQFKKNEIDFLQNNLEPEIVEIKDSNTMKNVSACHYCKSAISKTKIGTKVLGYRFKCMGCGRYFNEGD